MPIWNRDENVYTVYDEFKDSLEKTGPKMASKAPRYEAVKELGDGGNAEVYLVHDKKLGIPLVAKVQRLLDTHFLPDHPRRVTVDPQHELMVEAQILAKLGRHRNLVDVYDYFEMENKSVLLEEYCSGGTLNKVMGKNEWLDDKEEILGLLRQMAAAIDYVHAHNLVHRDIKPDNFFFQDESRQVFKLGDMGTTANTGTVGFVGSPGYFSPELFSGEPYTYAGDIFSFGNIAMILLTRHGIWDQAEAYEKGIDMARTWDKDVVQVEASLYLAKYESLVNKLKPVFVKNMICDRLGISMEQFFELDRVFAKVLNEDPEKRHKSAHEFVQELVSGLQTFSSPAKSYESVKL